MAMGGLNPVGFSGAVECGGFAAISSVWKQQKLKTSAGDLR